MVEPFEAAILAFLGRGELPEDELLLDVVLADAEFDAIWRHALGEDVSERMAAFDMVQRTKGAPRDEALAELVSVVTRSRGSRGSQI